MAKRDFLITLDEHSKLSDVAKSLEDRGLDVRRTYPRSNTIIGTGDSSLFESLQNVDGVENIRKEGTINLPDMGEKIPQ